MGYRLPAAYNPADFWLGLVSCPAAAADEDDDEEEDKVCIIDKATDESVMHLVESSARSPYIIQDPLPVETSHRELRAVQGLKVALWTLFKLNVWRGLLQTRRDMFSFCLRVAVCILVGLTFGLLYLGQATSNWRALVGLLSVMVSCLLFMVGIVQGWAFPAEWTLVAREYMSGGNALGPYLLAKVVYNLPYMLGPLLLTLVVYGLIGLQQDLSSFASYVVVVFMVQQVSTALGLFCASFSANPMIALSLCPALMSPMVVFAGVLYQRTAVPAYLSWIQDLSIVNYGFAALLASQVNVLPSVPRAMALAFCEVDPNRGISGDVARLAAMTVGLYALTFVNLKARVLLLSKS